MCKEWPKPTVLLLILQDNEGMLITNKTRIYELRIFVIRIFVTPIRNSLPIDLCHVNFLLIKPETLGSSHT